MGIGVGLCVGAAGSAAVRDAFVSGLQQSYLLCLALAVIGIFVALSLDDRSCVGWMQETIMEIL
jgi:hypothetical protein